MANVAIMGYGTVGQGVYAALSANADEIAARAFGERIVVTRVLDLKPFPGDPAERLLTRSFDDIINDEQITIVVETMGGLNPAYQFVKALLMKGKSVVTSNKELVANHAPELIALSEANKCRFLFEASVCGGIPVIRTITNALTADRISAISGILNGTTNFMLTKMDQEGAAFDEVLAEAQRLGYAEADPSADVDGLDVRRKLAILASLAAERHVVDTEIHTEGIREITDIDMAYARQLGMTIKLIAMAHIGHRAVSAVVAPFLVDGGDLFANVSDVYNAVRITGNCLDDIALYGKGAGKMATGSAVVSNVVDATRGPRAKSPRVWPNVPVDVRDAGAGEMRRFLRLAYHNEEGARSAVWDAFGLETHILTIDEAGGEFGVLTPRMSGTELNGRVARILAGGAVSGVVATLRVYDQGDV